MEMEFRIGPTPMDQGCDFLEKSSVLYGEVSAASLLLSSALWFIKCFHAYYLIESLQ